MAGRMRRSVILGLLGLVALVVVASVVLLPRWLTDRHTQAVPTGPPPSGTWNQTHWIDLPPGWRVVARNVSRTEESTSLDGPDGNGCLVIVFPGEVDPQLRPVRTERVRVGGIEGVYGPLDPDFGPYSFVLSWPYATGKWAQVRCDLDREVLLDLAERVRFEPNPVPVPFELAAVPEGFAVTDLIASEEPEERSTGIYLRQGDGGFDAVVLWIGNQTDSDLRPPQAEVERLAVNGRPVELRSLTQSLCFVASSDPVCIQVSVGDVATDWAASSRDLALRTAAHLTPVDDPHDRSTWMNADQALPR